MPASYPSAIWSPSAIATGTKLEAVLATDLAAEIDAIETELGINVHGSAGSLRDRLNMFMDADGQVPYWRNVDAASSAEYKSLRAGTTLVETDDLTDVNFGGTYTITFAAGDVDATQKSVVAFVSMETAASDLSDPTEPAVVNFVYASGTTTSFQVLICDGNGYLPAPGTSCVVHWIVVENTPHGGTGF